MYSCSSTAPVSLACHCAAATRLIGHSVDPPLTKPNAFAESSPCLRATSSSLRAIAASTTLYIASRHVTGRARSRSFGSGATSPNLSTEGVSPAKMRCVMCRQRFQL